MHNISNRSKANVVRQVCSILSLLTATTLTTSSNAQQDVITEVVVTVQKRSESVQEVPLAITAFSGDFIADVNLDDVKDLVAYTPGLTGNSQGSFIDVLQIRGIYTSDYGVAGDPSVGIFKNGLYQGRSGAVVTSLYDIERAEIARGSQGFLIGRNSIAGAINVFTRRPSFQDADAYVEIDIGERNHQSLEAATNITLTQNIAARLAVYSSREDGYVDDVFDRSRKDLLGHDKQAARLSLRSEYGNTEINFMVEYEDRELAGTIYRAIPRGETWQALQELFGVTLMGDADDLDSDLSLGEGDDVEIWSLGLQIDHDLGWARLTSFTGYKDHTWNYAEDYDGTPLHISSYTQDQQGEYLEQEFRLVSNTEGAFTWYAGISGYRESIDALFRQVADEEVMCVFYLSADGYNNCTEYLADYGEVFTPNPDGLVERNRVKGEYSGFAAYFDLNFAFSDTIDASIGARFTRDSKKFKIHAFDVASDLGPFYGIGYTTDGFIGDKKTWQDIAPRALLRIQPNDEWMLFGSVTRGYKAGGFGSFAVNPEPEFGQLDLTEDAFSPAPFDPEQVISYEIGSKHTLAGGLTRLDLSAYYYDYEDLQVVVEGPGGGIRVDNVGKVAGWGVEGSLQMVLGANWDLFVSGAWADSEMTRVQALCDDSDSCEGNGLPGLPEFSYGIVLRGEFLAAAGEWIGSVEAFGQTRTYGGFARNRLFQNDGWTELAIRAGYRSSEGWEVVAYVENALDKRYFDGVFEDVGILPAATYGPSRPRTVGVRIGWNFN